MASTDVQSVSSPPVWEMENIRSFLTGTYLTVVLDSVFSVIYIAVMIAQLGVTGSWPCLWRQSVTTSPWACVNG